MQQQNIVFIESTDNYPHKFTANNSKVRIVIDGLVAAGAKCHMVNRIYGSKQSSIANVTQEYVDGIDVWSLPRFTKNKLGLISNFINHVKIVKSLKRKGENNILVMGGPIFPFFLFFALVYRMIGFRTAVMITEWARDFEDASMLKKIDYFFYDTFFGFFVSMIFPISEFLIEKCKKFNKPLFKVPILSPMPETIEPKNEEKYFLLCSTLGYKENILTIINSFELFCQRNVCSDYRLKLILSGPDAQMAEVKQYISKKGLSIDIYSQIPYNQLLELYKNANALLIPLKNSLRDRARFSQKIAEYISTGRPIVTNAVGDISFYFKNLENAYIADDYSPEAYASIMFRVAESPKEAEKIGEKGYLTGKREFDNQIVCREMVKFLTQFEE